MTELQGVNVWEAGPPLGSKDKRLGLINDVPKAEDLLHLKDLSHLRKRLSDQNYLKSQRKNPPTVVHYNA